MIAIDILEEGYIILRNVVPQDELEGLRRAYETLIDCQKQIWTDKSIPTWETSPQPRLQLSLFPFAGAGRHNAGAAASRYSVEN